MTLLPDIDVWVVLRRDVSQIGFCAGGRGYLSLEALDASRKKMVWQVAFLCLMGIAVDESTGLSRGAAGWVNGLAPDESPLPETGGIVSFPRQSELKSFQSGCWPPSADIDSRLLLEILRWKGIRVGFH